MALVVVGPFVAEDVTGGAQVLALVARLLAAVGKNVLMQARLAFTIGAGEPVIEKVCFPGVAPGVFLLFLDLADRTLTVVLLLVHILPGTVGMGGQLGNGYGTLGIAGLTGLLPGSGLLTGGWLGHRSRIPAVGFRVCGIGNVCDR